MIESLALSALLLLGGANDDSDGLTIGAEIDDASRIRVSGEDAAPGTSAGAGTPPAAPPLRGPTPVGAADSSSSWSYPWDREATRIECIFEYFWTGQAPSCAPVDAPVVAGGSGGVVDPVVVVGSIRSEEVSRRLVPSAVSLQPPLGTKLYESMPVIAYSSGESQSFELVVLGTPVSISARPSSFLWDWQDGEPVSTSGPGLPWPDQTVEHRYPPGEYRVTLTTTWVVTATVAGRSIELPSPGRTTASSPVFTVRELDVHLVTPLGVEG